MADLEKLLVYVRGVESVLTEELNQKLFERGIDVINFEEKILRFIEKEKLLGTRDRFAKAMMDKLNKKIDQGYYGWDDPTVYQQLLDKFTDHCSKVLTPENLIDIANFAMFLWNIKNQEAEVDNG